MDTNNNTSNPNKDRQQTDPELHHLTTNVDGEKLKRHVKELLDRRHKQLNDQVKTMMNEHIAKLETVKRSILLEYEQSKQDSEIDDESLRTLLRKEKGADL